MIDDIPVFDAVIHAYNMETSNFANKWAEPTAINVHASCYRSGKPGYRLPFDQWARDWGIDETASMAFAESHIDFAAYHVLPIGAYKDGLCSFEKAQEAQDRWPDRFVVYAGVDPMEGPGALKELERQVELLNGTPGLKLYPNSWRDDEVLDWRMDDPEVAFPLFERAQQLGVKVVAVHKAVPLGPYPLDAYRVDDIDRAAAAFPDLNFEVVHGGSAFIEETAWQLARFPNVFVNLEITSALAYSKPKSWQHALAGLMQVGGTAVLDRVTWGSGAMAMHPEPMLQAFWNFTFDDDVLVRYSLDQITRDQKKAILGQNYARLLDLDLEARLLRVQGDEFSRMKPGPPCAPYSTTRSAGHAE